MNFDSPSQIVDILLVEDNAGDVRLTQEVLSDSKIRNNLMVATNGEEALACLRKQGKFRDFARPDIILLDLNLPIKDGREVLARNGGGPRPQTHPRRDPHHLPRRRGDPQNLQSPRQLLRHQTCGSGPVHQGREIAGGLLASNSETAQPQTIIEKRFKILLVEDNAGDARLIQESLLETPPANPSTWRSPTGSLQPCDA